MSGVILLTGAFVQNVVERAVRHPVCDDDRVRGRRQTRTQNREHIRMGKYPGMEPGGKVGREGEERGVESGEERHTRGRKPDEGLTETDNVCEMPRQRNT